ncbi:MAG: rRNA pseudouridine synthase [Alphaproteobacteria bacterium]|nr:rRNA pseudouridine synthase [Alphaproteobacteria bacterium]
MSERIAKRLARAGLCSRREAERWIAAGRVSIDGALVRTPAVTVDDASRIAVDGKALPRAERTRLWRYHKPKGVMTTRSDPAGRPTVFAALPPARRNLIAVGRLDFNSEGLLLLTNDGALARRLALPSSGCLRRYRVRVRGRVDETALARLAPGLTVAGTRYGPIAARLERQQASNAWLEVTLTEGKNREVRQALAAVGYPVSRLIRIGFGPFALADLAPGALAEVPLEELAAAVTAAAAPPRLRTARAHHRR